MTYIPVNSSDLRCESVTCLVVMTLGHTKLIICFLSTLPSEIDQATRLLIFYFFQN